MWGVWSRGVVTGQRARCECGHLTLTAVVFPGQGSQHPGMRDELAAAWPELLEAAEAAGDGGMLAVMGGREDVNPIAEPLRLTLANDNSPRQVVLSGDRIALKTAAQRAEESGMRAIELPVAGAFHSPAMRAVVPKFRSALAEVEFRPPRIPVLCCLTAQPFDDIRGRLADGLVSPVRWRDTVVHMHDHGVTRFVETGPGRVLAGLIKRTVKGVETTTVEPAHA